MAQLEAEQIGARIRQARLEAGLTQEQLAEMASFSKRSLQGYELGVTIPYRHLRELAGLLDRTPEWFLYGHEEPDVGVEERLDRIERVLEALVAQLARDGDEVPPE